MDDQNLKIVISAIDNASSQIKTLSDNVESAMKKVTTSTDAAGVSQENLTRAVFNGTAAWDMVKRGLEMVKGYFEEGVKSAVDYDASLAQISGTLKDIGPSAEAQLPSIDKFLNTLSKIGVSDNAAAEAFNKIVKASRDVGQSMQLMHLAMNLTSSGYYDLETNATNLANVLTGHGMRAAMAYKLVLQDNATTADYLDAIIKKVSLTQEDWAKTSEGQLAVMKEDYDNLQQAVGEGLLNAFYGFTQEAVADMNKTQDSLNTVSDDVAIFGIEAGGAFEMVVLGIKTIIQGLQGLANSAADTFTSLVDGARAAGAALSGNFDAAGSYMDQAMTMSHAAGVDINTTITKIGQNADQAGQKWKEMTNPTATLNNIKMVREAEQMSANSAKQNGIDAVNRQKQGADAAGKVAEALQKLSDEYDKMTQNAEQDLASLADAFNDKMGQIQDDIHKTISSIEDLQKSYKDASRDAAQAFNTQRGDETKTVAEDIVASETKIADLKVQLSKATTKEQVAGLLEQLAAEQKNYDSTAEFRTAHAAEIQAAEAKSKKTLLQQEIDDYTAKAALEDAAYAKSEAAAKADYKKKLAQLNQELLDKQTEWAKEVKLYETRTTQINAMLDQANDYFAKLSADRQATTEKEVNAEIAKFQQLAQAISSVKSASQSALATIQVPSLQGGSVAKHESGGFVDAPRGTEVPIIAHGGELVIPAEQAGSRGGGSPITIQIINPSVRSDADIAEIRKQIEQFMRPLLMNTKIIHS